MSLKYVLYVVLITGLLLSAFTLIQLGEVLSHLEKEKQKLTRAKTDIMRKKALVQSLKERLKEENLPTYSEEEALERLVGFIDSLRGSYEVDIVGDIEKEGKVWKAELRLLFKPSDGRDIAGRLRKLIAAKSPVVHIKGVHIAWEPVGGVEIELTILQPFMEAKG